MKVFSGSRIGGNWSLTYGEAGGYMKTSTGPDLAVLWLKVLATPVVGTRLEAYTQKAGLSGDYVVRMAVTQLLDALEAGKDGE